MNQEEIDLKEKLNQLRAQFIDYMANTRKICATWLRQTTVHMDTFCRFIGNIHTIDTLARIDKEIINQFQLHLYNEHLLSPNTVRCYLVTLRNFFSYLYMNSFIITNPMLGLELIKSPRPYYPKNKHYYTWQELIARYRKHHLRNRYTIANLKQKLFSIEQFIGFLKTQGVKTIYKIKPIHLEGFKKYLNTYYTNSNTHIFMKVLRLRFACQFIKFFYFKGYLNTNPCCNIDYSKYRQEIGALNITSKRIQRKPKTRLEELIERYLTYRDSVGYSLRSFMSSITPFRQYFLKEGISDPDQVTKAHILGYQNWLTQLRYKGNKYSSSTIQKFLSGPRRFFRFLIKYDMAKNDPTIVIDLPKDSRSLPRTLMTHNDAYRLLEAPDISTVVGMRDRAILEVFYSTGGRADEIAHLQVADIDFGEGLIRINNPKGGPRFQRVVAIGESACFWVKRYMATARPVLAGSIRQNPYLFLSTRGNRIGGSTLNEITRQYAARLGLRKQITSHSWRVTCATLLLKNGADIRYVQEQLGHHCIASTQRYTRLHPKDLKKIHHKFHPQEIRLRKDKKLLPG